MIEISTLTKVFGSGQEAMTALDNVSVTIAENEFFTLLGPSGCGKTTLLRMIAGFELPDTGEIRLDGQPVTHLPPHHRPINTVFQNYALFPHMNVAQNVGFGLEMLGRDRKEIDATVARTLELVRLDHLAGRRIDQLSGGQQQRVALARALAPAPKVLLLDEPLSALDFKLRKEMQSELKRLQLETGITFVFVTHDQEEALTMSDRIAVMSAGKILQIGRPMDIYDRPAARFVADFIGDINFIEGTVTDGGTVATGSGDLAVTAPLPASGTTVTLAIRPEHVMPGAEGPNSLAGTLAERVYFGSGTVLEVDLGATRISCRTGDAPFAEGAPLSVTLPPERLQVLQD
ncbi:ABC transporter ATP-binding protein [Oceanomicrobium pacificus]|uniref:Spermidine/putrescine import ATP-binding protein PotA n=1 Tax=Oceanomicrobium pacificus TaxID=2692916 RepID=A0A6B0TSG6_9RHOB|nr:ABC transporter ATP-binding protein [Oceanomicrobium pacificus]MXU65679.1 polyamine ABC transporter ATP-binding protein [Oceanomicrobium pacificus]